MENDRRTKEFLFELAKFWEVEESVLKAEIWKLNEHRKRTNLLPALIPFDPEQWDTYRDILASVAKCPICHFPVKRRLNGIWGKAWGCEEHLGVSIVMQLRLKMGHDPITVLEFGKNYVLKSGQPG